MKAIFYIDGKPRWQTVKGEWAMMLTYGERLVFFDEMTAMVGQEMVVKRGIVCSRSVDLVRGVIEVHVSEDDPERPPETP